MKLLYWPQLSMRSYSDPPKWLVESDSQVNKMLGWMRHLPDDWDWTWMLPLQPRWQDSDYPWLPSNARVTHVDWAPNVLTDRFAFPMSEVLEIIEAGEYDVAIIEAIEHAAGFRAAQQHLGKEFPIVGMIGLYDLRWDPFYLRQLESVLACDLVVFPLDVIMRNWWLRVHAIVDGIDTEVNTMVVPAIFDPTEVLSHQPTPIRSKSPRIFFISRLSDDMRTKASLFVEAVCQLREEGMEFEVWVANPTGVSSPFPERDEHGPDAAGDLIGPIATREEYINRLWNADIVPILYSLEDSYSVGACEAIATKNIIVCPEGPGIRTELTIEGLKKALKLAYMAVKSPAVRDGYFDQQEEWLAKNRSVTSNIGELRQALERIANEHRSTSP